MMSFNVVVSVLVGVAWLAFSSHALRLLLRSKMYSGWRLVVCALIVLLVPFLGAKFMIQLVAPPRVPAGDMKDRAEPDIGDLNAIDSDRSH